MIANNIAPTRHFLFIMAVCWLIVAIGFRYAVREDAGQHERRPVFVLPDKSIIYLGIIAFCSMICEGTMFDWSGVYFKKIVLAEKALRSEEHTSELQSLMRITYAVFCLKKKTTII